ncbi:putative aldo-keto reductase yakc protein [Eutypa lata UCREL1]|uniref:Putative aldo-keto reductase yakc protein n=1 Tax=Eutypa lata (strain UCR-EL1) TaxID=1287681 RepID=M7TS42_EUTLA|nr:putative aldo-keto reductase yakc protein [Eutypa lata UCREL1]
MAPQIPARQLGRDGPKIPAVGFGLMGLSIGYGAVDSDEERLKVLDRAWELGCTNWDTADAYGDNEDIIGKWFKLHPERRADIFLATKFGLKQNAEGGIGVDSSPEYCRQSVERSLKRLGVQQIDLYYIHRADPTIPIEKPVEVLKEFVRDGKIKYLGLSEVSSSTLRRAHAIHPIHAVQVEYNPWTLDIEGPSGTYLLDTCKELGVSVFAYSPLGRGIMTGRFRSAADFEADDSRKLLARFQGENFQKNLELVDKFSEVAKRKGCSPSQLVLAWLVAQSNNVFVIPGTKKIPYLEQNFSASEVVISKDEEKELRKLVSEAGVSGDRSAMFGNYVDTAPLGG